MNNSDFVSESYTDALGIERVVSAATREHFIAALAKLPHTGIAPATLVLRDGDALAIDVTLPAECWEEDVLWTVTDERGAVKAGTLALRDTPVVHVFERDGTKLDTRRVTLPFTVAANTYRVTLDVRTFGHAGIDVIATPRRAYLPRRESRIWGIAVQLYTLRSQRNWGIGDFTDLERMCEIAGAAGATLVGVNPLHAAHRTDPEAASPYSPTSRRYLNWLAIDVDLVPEAADADVRHYVASIAGDLAALRAKDFVDYSGVAMVKAPALKLCFAGLRGERTAKFAEFVQRGGAELLHFATHEALVARYGRNMAHWPPALQQNEPASVAAFQRAEPRAVEFSMYLQWLAAEQLDDVAATAKTHDVELFRDLAVGVEAGGAEAWGTGDYIATASVGAPPDLLNTLGQDWGLPPLSPATLAHNGYAAFAGLLADNMIAAGALRIDHAMSLMRLFWIPHGSPPVDGAYITYPYDDLLGILAQESVRAKCMIIGEDLGTVPPGFREKMAANNILSYRILLFERDGNGRFVPPHDYPELALAATGTHDLPPLAGWLEGDDISLHLRLGLLSEAEAEHLHVARTGSIAALIEALRASGDLAVTEESNAAIALGAYCFLARSPARIVMLQIEDAMGERTPVNIPGTNLEYPNWRRKLHDDLETIAADGRLERFARALRELRPRA